MATPAPVGSAKSSESQQPLSKEELRKMHAYWRAANYLSVGQIYLYENPLLREALKIGHIKPRLLGHWGTTPGLNFIYVHFNRLIKKHALNVIYITGPGHGGPGLVANTYLEGTYSVFYPHIPMSADGMKRIEHSSPFPEAFPAMWLLKHPDQFMKVESSDIPLRTPTAQLSTIRTFWFVV